MDLYIKGVPPVGTSKSTAKLMKTGQTTSYRTGDDGDLETGRNIDFYTLAENNPFGNTNRFTSTTGTQTYTNGIAIDWSTYDGSTVLGYRITTNVSAVTWNAAIDACLAVSIGTFTTGWRLTNRNELLNIANVSITNLLNYSPFNIINLNGMWTSTTYAGDPQNAWMLNAFLGNVFHQLKTNPANGFYLPCRTFTVTGTTLS